MEGGGGDKSRHSSHLGGITVVTKDTHLGGGVGGCCGNNRDE